MNNLIDEKYYQIELNTISANTYRLFSIYINVSNNLELFVSDGEEITPENLNKLIESNITKVYINKKDLNFYNSYVLENLPLMLHDPKLSIREKAEIAHNSVTKMGHFFFEKPETEILKVFESVISILTDFIIEEDEAIYDLIGLSSLDFKLATHSINVGLFSTGLAKIFLDDDSSHNMKEIAIGFFLHDIGKCMIPVDILYKSQPLTHDEWKMLKQHPSLGYKLLNKFKVYSEEAKTIVMHHHERIDGRGYPLGLIGDKINIYCKICSLADSFEALTSYRPYRINRPKSVNFFTALQILKKEMLNEIDPFLFKKFVLLFTKVPVRH